MEPHGAVTEASGLRNDTEHRNGMWVRAEVPSYERTEQVSRCWRRLIRRMKASTEMSR